MRIIIMALLCWILGIVLILYGVCIMRLNSGTPFFAVWYFLGIVFIAFGICFQRGWWSTFPRACRLLIECVFCLGIAAVAATWIMIGTKFHAEGPDDLDTVVVLGAQVRKDGPSQVLKWRLDTAADYLESHPQTTCIVSGGKGKNEPVSESAAMKQYLVQRGIDSDRIKLEDQSTNTVSNLKNSRKLLGNDQKVGIVTNNFHMFRALRLARRAGYRDVCGMAAPSNSFYLMNNMLRETFGIVKDWAAGNL